MNVDERDSRHEKWRVLLEEYEKSGQSQRAFCVDRGLPLSQFGYYRSIIKSKRYTSLSAGEVAPIRIKKAEPSALSEIKIMLPNGFHCVFSGEREVLYIKQLVEALLSC